MKSNHTKEITCPEIAHEEVGATASGDPECGSVAGVVGVEQAGLG